MSLIISLILLTCAITFLRQKPLSLWDAPRGKWTHLKTIKASYLLSVLLIIVFWTTANMTMGTPDTNHLFQWGLITDNVMAGHVWQLITNNFLHLNALHLYSNIIALLLLTTYEQRVGFHRYATIFFLSGLASSTLRLFIGEFDVSVGASAGIYGLAAAYFMDREDIWHKKWPHALCGFILTAAFLSYSSGQKITDLQIDHWSHILGALTAIIYIAIFPRTLSAPPEEEESTPIARSKNTYESLIGKGAALITLAACLYIIAFSWNLSPTLRYNEAIFDRTIEKLSKQNPACNKSLLKSKPKNAIQACSLLADKGNVNAIFVVAEILNGYPNDEAQALSLEFYSMAAKRDHRDATYKHAVRLEQKARLPIEYQHATKLYKKAAQAGHAAAQLKVARMPDTLPDVAAALLAEAKSKGVYDIFPFLPLSPF